MKIFKILLVSVVLNALLACNFAQAQQKSDSLESKNQHIPFQLSFVPYFSTNPFRSWPVDVSLNIIGGVNEEVDVFEAGGVFNIVKHDAGKCQLAGMMNFTGGKSTGLQAAGFLNTANSVKGLQAAGYVNLTKTNVEVAQVAGFVNLAGGKVHGVQIAGFTSLANQVEGLQISGFSNLTHKNTGAQLAGYVNISQSTDGLQLAGFANVTGDITGLQTAGFVNVAHDVAGSQISGFINIAHDITGVQLGVINISDSCSGLPIGVISIVRNGYHKFEIAGDEFTYVGLSFKSGVDHFYTILNAGYRPFETDAPYWSYGAGIGSLFGGNDKYHYNIEILSRQIFKGTTCDFDNSLNTLFLGIDRKLYNDMSLNIGLTCNLLVLDKKGSHYNNTFKDIAPYTLVDYEVRDYQVQSWIGGRLAFRF